jgi:hypothetical protein
LAIFWQGAISDGVKMFGGIVGKVGVKFIASPIARPRFHPELSLKR